MSGYQVVPGTPVEVSAAAPVDVTASCPSGSYALSGGVAKVDGTGELTLHGSSPATAVVEDAYVATGWTTRVTVAGGTATAEPWVVCATVN